MSDHPTDSLRATYNPEGSERREIQRRMLDILLYVDKLCKKHQIRYWLSSGTLLGAIRHGGFIPWDDDVDIEMFASDYKKLLRVLQQSAGDSPYAVQTSGNDLEFLEAFYRVVDTRTKVRQFSMGKCQYEYDGLAIDVFSISPSFSKKFHYLIYGIHTVFLFRLNRISSRRIRRALIRINKLWIDNLLLPCSEWITRLIPSSTLRTNIGCGYLCKLNREMLLPLKEGVFEGHTFPIPNDTDAYLQSMYGNYMELPDNRNECPKEVIKL